MNKPSAYVYKVTHKESGEFYLGSRTTKIVRENRSPEQDFCVHYFTSNSAMRVELQKYPEKYHIEILFRSNESFINKKSGEIEWVAYWEEQRLIKESFGSPLCVNKNYHDPETGSMGRFASKPRTEIEKKNLSTKRKGKAVMYDSDGNRYNVKRGTKEVNGVKLHGNQKTKCLYVDKDGNHHMLQKDDEKIKSLKLTPIQSNKATYKDKDGNHYNLEISDPKIKELNLSHVNTGKSHSEETKKQYREKRKGAGNAMFGRIKEVCCFDLITKEFKRVAKNIFDTTPSLVGVNNLEAKKHKKN